MGFAAGGGGARLPTPLKVAEDGEPKMSGCGEGAARQASVETHGGGSPLGGAAQPGALVQACAS
ncbi:MAG TPA: hypothetical protein VN817_01720 [Solirubrobacteraceae bacterium]|nr:hypothetical protein [Solirubrobacteraceae bacterium]